MNFRRYSSSRVFVSIIWCLLLGACLFMFAWRFIYSSHFANSWDEVDFALALSRYDLLAMQPHFPGYPYFILGGIWIHTWVSDPARALSNFNVLMTLSSLIPLYLLGRKRYSPLWSALLTLFVQSLTYLWLISTQPMSEGTAIALLWWYIWSLRLGMKKQTWQALILPSFLFGLLMGVRTSLAPFGIGLLLLWAYDWHNNPQAYPRRFIFAVLHTLLFQLFWVAGLLSTEGSLRGFIQLASAFVVGHFTTWGGGMTAKPLIPEDAGSVWIRVKELLIDNLYWTGFSSHSLVLAISFGLLLVLACFSYHRGNNKTEERFQLGLAGMLLLYALWVLFAQNLDKPRHIAPLLGAASFLLFHRLFPPAADMLKVRLHPLKLLLLLAVIGLQMFHGAMLSKQQAIELPATYQLAEAVRHLPTDGTLYTWEETRVLQYLKVPFSHKQIYTYAYFLIEAKASKGYPIYVTDHVVQGFEQQVGDLSAHLRKVAVFQANPLFEPVYHDIILYEWIDL